MRLSLRYDMRAPAIGAPAEVLYAASLDQCEWADRLGFDTVYLAEHHGADDGYCASRSSRRRRSPPGRPRCGSTCRPCCR